MLFTTTLYQKPPERDTLNYAVYHDTLSKTTRKRQTQLCCLPRHFIKIHQKETTRKRHSQLCCLLRHFIKITRKRHTQSCCLLRHFIEIHQKETLSIMLFTMTLYQKPPERDRLNYAVYNDTLSKTTRKRHSQLCCLLRHFIKIHQKETLSIMLFTTTLYQKPPERDTLNYAVYYDTLSKTTRKRHSQLCCLQ